MFNVLLVAIAIAIPLLMARYLRLSSPNQTSTGAALGNALQELDRLTTRPSVEYKLETEHQVQPVENDKGGE